MLSSFINASIENVTDNLCAFIFQLHNDGVTLRFHMRSDRLMVIRPSKYWNYLSLCFCVVGLLDCLTLEETFVYERNRPKIFSQFSNEESFVAVSFPSLWSWLTFSILLFEWDKMKAFNEAWNMQFFFWIVENQQEMNQILFFWS